IPELTSISFRPPHIDVQGIKSWFPANVYSGRQTVLTNGVSSTGSLIREICDSARNGRKKFQSEDKCMRRDIHSFFLAAVLFNMIGVLPAVGQEGKGSITGSVKDSSGGALKGALVELQPTGTRAVSDDQGQFRITDVAAGEYTLMVTYVGLTNFTNTVKVNAGQAASADA